MRTLFIGSTKRGYLTLKALLDQKVTVAGVISLEQDSHEVERYEEPIRAMAMAKNIPFYETKWMKDRDYAQIIARELKPDIGLVVGCRILIQKEIYEAPPKGILAVHDSWLPEYRGFAPLNWAILNGEKSTGVTLFYLSELMDGGDMVARKKILIGRDETAPQVYEKVCAETVKLILKALPLLKRGKAPRIKQDYEKGSFTCSRTPADGVIDWNRSTRDIYNLVRALAYPYPGACTFLGGKRLWIWKANPLLNPLRYAGRIPGKVVGLSVAQGTMDVLTGDGILRVNEVQEEGGSKAPAAQVVKSIKTTLGLNQLAFLEELERLKNKGES